MDVCPFIPVQNVSMEECVQCANEFGQRLSDMLSVPGVFVQAKVMLFVSRIV